MPGIKFLEQRFAILLIVIVIFGAAIRLYDLGNYPQIFDQDEMQVGYDAWSLWTTGRDQHGVSFPLRFRSYNDYLPPVGIYVAAPFVGLLSPTYETTRLPVVLSSIATLVLVALLTRTWFGPSTAIIATLLLAIDPWHIKYSRTAYPPSLVVFLLVLGIFTFTIGIKRASSQSEPRLEWKTFGLFLISGLSFGLLVGTYSPMFIQSPLLAFACLVAVLGTWRKHWRYTLIWVVLCAVFASPFILDQITNWQIYQTRFEDISVFQQSDWPIQIAINYLKHISPRRLFITGYDTTHLRMPYGIGQMYWITAVFMLVGFAALIVRYRRQQSFINLLILTGLWLLTFPAAGILTGSDPVEHRVYSLLPLPDIMAGLGIVAMVEILQRYRRPIRTFAYLATLLIFVVYSTNYLTRFFTPVDQLQKMPYNTGLRPVIQSVIAQTTPCDTIWMQSMNQAYMYYIFLSQFPPADYLALDVTKSTITGLPYLYVPQVGNWRFGDYPEHDIPLAEASDDCETPRTIYLTLQSDLPQEWERLDTGTTTAEPTQWQAVVLEAPIIEQNFWDRTAAQPGGGGFTMP